MSPVILITSSSVPYHWQFTPGPHFGRTQSELW